MQIGIRQAIADILAAMGPLNADQLFELMPPHITNRGSIAPALSQLRAAGAISATRAPGAAPVYRLEDPTLVPVQQVSFRAVSHHTKHQPVGKERSLPPVEVDAAAGTAPQEAPPSEPPARPTGVEYYAIAKFPDGSKLRLTLEQALALQGR